MVQEANYFLEEGSVIAAELTCVSSNLEGIRAKNRLSK
jgi:hypothetical protein